MFATHAQRCCYFQYEFEASFVEIYNETLRDLLGNGDTKIKHEIKLVNSKTNELMVTNQTTVRVTSPQQVTPTSCTLLTHP